MFTLDHKIKKPANLVFEYLTNMEKFVNIHPIIYKMDELGDGNYKVYEKLKLGFIPCNFTYSANVKSDATNKTVNIKAVVMKMTHIEMIFKLSEENGQTHIHETINFTSPLPIKGFMQSVFKKQHKQLFLNIEKI